MNNEEVNLRWQNYRKANFDKPSARENELSKVFQLINPRDGQHILEIGTGNGYLTIPLAKAVGSQGFVLTADVSRENLESVEKTKGDLHIETRLFSDNEPICKNDELGKFDIVASIATLHHFDNRSEGTGENNRISALKAFYSYLKPGGKLVIADVTHGTISQKYFDSIDNPKHCHPNGHPHDFFTLERLTEVVKEVGYKDVDVIIEYVPWKFESEEEAKNFIHTIHNAKCTPEESFEISKNVLGFKKVDDHFELGWELFFLTARK